MWTYSTNFMGHASIRWYEENNIPFTTEKTFSKLFDKEIEIKHYEQYAGGRIDCYCSNKLDENYNPFNQELCLPIMKASSFNKFSKWLSSFYSNKLLSTEELFKLFEEKTNENLELFQER